MKFRNMDCIPPQNQPRINVPPAPLPALSTA